jgi:uncharacterized protein YjiS (DUF1127 family)
MPPASEERAMRQRAPYASQALPARRDVPAAPPHRPLPRAARPPRLVAALLWLVRLLFVQPVGRRARAERLGALPERTLRDIGLKRADVRAVTWGMLPLRDVAPAYPSAGPLYVCGRPDFPLTLVRLGKAA